MRAHWLCEACAAMYRLRWRSHAACSHAAGDCGACGKRVARGERREWHVYEAPNGLELF